MFSSKPTWTDIDAIKVLNIHLVQCSAKWTDLAILEHWLKTNTQRLHKYNLLLNC